MIYSRSFNDELFGMMSEFISEPVIKCDKFPAWQDAHNYLKFIIDKPGCKINVDIDCFINEDAVYELLEDMKQDGYTHCGMRDHFDTCPHRFNNEKVMNPFFNIFSPHCADLVKDIEPDFEDMEPYNSLFETLHNNGKPLYLNALTLNDGISTALFSQNNELLCLHSWYAREWGNDHRERILKVYNDALRLFKKN